MLIERLGRIKLREKHSRYISKPVSMYIASANKADLPCSGRSNNAGHLERALEPGKMRPAV
jgi:hypothetical protein